MKPFISIALLIYSFHSFSGVGEVINIIGSESYLVRGKNRLNLSLGFELEAGDRVFTKNSVTVIYLEPLGQLSLSKNSEIKISQEPFVIDFIQGIIRLQWMKDATGGIEQKIRTKDVAFEFNGGDFELDLEEAHVDLDVYEGEVEVTSPYVNTFVPYFVKAKEGFRYVKKGYGFEKREFSPRFKEAGFESKEKIQKLWNKRKKTGGQQRAPRMK